MSDRSPPLELPRLVMRHALRAAAVALVLALLLGGWRIADDIESEVDSAAALAGLMARLAGPQPEDDRAALSALVEAQREHPLRHLELRVTGPGGRLLLGPPPPEPLGWPLEALITLHRALLPPQQAARHAWPMSRPDGTAWTVTLATSRESERIEAIGSLAGVLLLLMGCIGLMLVVMRWKLREAFRPLAAMLSAIGAIERQELNGVARLPTMPVRELESVAAALRHLAAALGRAETERRLLSRKMITLQDNERVRLARELHDEMGQQLTALRVDAAWLKRTLAGDIAAQQVVQGMAERCAALQGGLRGLLSRLHPIELRGPEGPPTLGTLRELLLAMVDDWSRTGAQTLDIAFDLQVRTSDGRTRPLSDADAATLALPDDVLQAAYRIAQEALTNVVRHANARRAMLRLTLERSANDDTPAEAGVVVCMVCDDGIGIADASDAIRQGNGLGGMQERAWAAGGELRWHADVDRREWPGFCLSARLPFGAADAASPASPH